MPEGTEEKMRRWKDDIEKVLRDTNFISKTAKPMVSLSYDATTGGIIRVQSPLRDDIQSSIRKDISGKIETDVLLISCLGVLLISCSGMISIRRRVAPQRDRKRRSGGARESPGGACFLPGSAAVQREG